MIKVGDKLPDGKLMESTEFDSGTQCAMPPKEVNVGEAAKGKKIAVFGLPGRLHADLLGEARAGLRAEHRRAEEEGRERGVVRGHQRRLRHGALGPSDQKALGKIRFLADGSAQWAKALGLELDLNGRGMGTRMNRFSMLVDNGVVKSLNVEGPGKFEVSDAGTMLKQLG